MKKEMIQVPNGKPKTNAQRKANHAKKYGAKAPLPKRGTGLKKK